MTPATPAPSPNDGEQHGSGPNAVPQPTQAQLTSPSGLVYDFSVTDEDYTAPERPLPYNGLTALPPVNDTTAMMRLPQALLADEPLTWRMNVLQQNKAAWKRSADARVTAAVEELLRQVWLPANHLEDHASACSSGAGPMFLFQRMGGTTSPTCQQPRM
jgi:hypothetical protein